MNDQRCIVKCAGICLGGRAGMILLVMFGMLAMSVACHESRPSGPVADAPAPSRPSLPRPNSPETSGGQEQSEKVDAIEGSQIELIRRADGPRLHWRVGNRELISSAGPALYTRSACDVQVQMERIEEGVLLHYTIANPTGSPQHTPDLVIGGIAMPRDTVEIVENARHVHLREPTEARDRNILHAMRSYPAESYSPVLGLRDSDVFLGSSVIYDVFATKLEVQMDYRWDRRAEHWSMVFQLWDERPDRSGDRPRAPSAAQLQPGEEITLTVSVAAVEPDSWVHAYSSYRDAFVERFGTVRYERSGEPIKAISFGTVAQVSSENPRGYNRRGFAGHGRMDQVGWAGLRQRAEQDFFPSGFRRVMFWQVSGVYRRPDSQNMVWEITSAWPEAMNRTVDEFRETIEAGLEVGLWWGRASQVSFAFDSGPREAWDPDDPAHNEAAFLELDRAYELGVRLIGKDAIQRSIAQDDGERPTSDVLFNQIMPMLHERYPEMFWIIEPAACDYLHLWGGTFIWSRDVRGPNEFIEYLIPGSETFAVFRPRREHRDLEGENAHMNQELVDQYMRYGYTPIIFSPSLHGLRINRELVPE